MRAPRYHFPDEVRSTTRAAAERMVRDGEIVETPEQLDAWIAQRPEVGASLARGGYGTKFTAGDLLPLLQVMVVKAGGPAPASDAPPPRSSRTRWVVGGVIALLVLLLSLLLAPDVRPHGSGAAPDRAAPAPP